MAGSEVREDLVQLTVAARGAGPDAGLMRELEAIVDGGGSLLDAAGVLASGESWNALYPPSQTPAEFSDAWLGSLLPGAGADLLAFGRDVVVPHIEAGDPVGALVLAAQVFLSGSAVPPDFADFARAFVGRSASAIEELAASEAAEDIIQLAVAAYDAAPGAALVAELEAVVDGGGSLLDAAGVLASGERWDALYPPTQTPGEFSDAWLGALLPGAGEALLAVGREVVVPHLEAGGGPADLVRAAQEFLSGPVVPADFAGFAAAFLNKARVAAEHSAVRELDGTAAELRDVLASVTGDDATARAAIDALGDQMPGDQMPGDQMPGDQMPGDQMPGGGSAGGGSAGGGSSGGGSAGAGSGGGGSDGGGSSGGGSAGAGSGGGGSAGAGSGGGGSAGAGSGGGGSAGAGSGGGGSAGAGSGGGGSAGGGSSGGGSAGGGSGGGGQTPAVPSTRDSTDDQGRVVLVEFDEDADGTYDRAEAYEYGAGGLKTKTAWYDDWALEADGSGKDLAGQAIDRALTVTDDNGDGTGESRRHDAYDEDGERIVESLFDTDNAPDGSWERAESYERDASGRVAVKRTGSASGTDPDAVAVAYAMQERYAYDGEGRKILTEFDEDNDGTYERAEAYEYGAGDLKTKTAWYDDWALEADGSGKDLAGQAIDRALTVTDDNSDGTGESSRRDLYDAAGALVVESLFDDDFDGAADRAEAHEYDGGGSKTATRFYDSWTGTFDLPAGEADRIWTYDASGRVASTAVRYDDNGDGTWDRIRRHAKDDQGRLALTEFDDDGDGTYERAEGYAWDGAAKVRTDFYDSWDESRDAAAQQADRARYVMRDYDADGSDDDSKTETFDGAGRAVRIAIDYDSDMDADRIETYVFGSDPADGRWLSLAEDFDGDGKTDLETSVTHHGTADKIATRERAYDDGSGGAAADDGTVDRRVHETFDADGALAAVKHDDDGDGTWDRGDRHARDDKGRIVLSEFDGDGNGVYERAEAYAWDGAGKVRTDFYDDWDESRDAAAQQADRALYVMRDYDADGSDDDSKTETFDGAGRAVRIAIDYDSDMDADRIETYVFGSDPADGRWLSLAEDFDGDGKTDLKTVVAHHGTADKIATQEKAYDDGSGGAAADDGTVDRRVHETFGVDGALAAAKHDHDGDGTWDRGDRHARDDKGRLALSEFDGDGDGVYERAEAYEYGAADAKVRTDFYDNWDEGKDAAAQQADRALHVMRDYDGDGSDDDSKTETFDGAGLAVKIEYDHGSDKVVDLTETYARGGGSTVRLAEHDDGSGGAAAGDGVIDRRVEETFDGAGALTRVRHDGDGDGTYEKASAYTYRGDGKLETELVELDDGSGGGAADDGVYDARRHDAYDDGGKFVVRSLFDDDNAPDGSWERAEGFERDTDDRVVLRKTADAVVGVDPDAVAFIYDKAETYILAGAGVSEIRYFDNYDGTSDFAGLADASAGRIKYDDDVDGIWNRMETYSRRGGYNVKLTEHDDGSGGAKADDGTIDKRVEESFDGGGALKVIRHDDDGGGTWNRAAYHGVEHDDDYKYNDIKYERFDAGTGKIALVLYDHDSDGTLDLAQKVDSHVEVESRHGTSHRPRILHVGNPSGDDPTTATVESVTAHERHSYWEGRYQSGNLKWIEYDDEIDGAYTRGEDYGFGGPTGREKILSIRYYDNWDESSPKISEYNRQFLVADADGDGAVDDYVFTQGFGVVYDYDGDGELDFMTRLSTSGIVNSQRRGVPIGDDPWQRDGDWTSETRTSVWSTDFVAIFIQNREQVLGLREIDDDFDGTYERAEAVIWARVGSASKHIRTDHYHDWNQTYDEADDTYDTNDLSGLTVSGQRHYRQNLDGRGGVNDSRYREYDDMGRTVLLEHDYGSDGVADYFEKLTYEGDSKDWKTLEKNENPRADDVFEYRITVERDGDGDVGKETIELDDGRGGGAADDGTFDRRVENAINTAASRSLSETTSTKYDNDNDGTWDVEDAFTWGTETQGPESAKRVLTGDNGDAADDVTVEIAFVYGTDGADVQAGAAGVQWIDLGPGGDDMTGGAGADVFVFEYGDGADIVRDLTAGDGILIREAGFDPADVSSTRIELKAGEESLRPGVPAALFPAAGEPATDVAVLSYGGGSGDRIYIVGGDSTTDYGAFFMAHAGDAGGG